MLTSHQVYGRNTLLLVCLPYPPGGIELMADSHSRIVPLHHDRPPDLRHRGATSELLASLYRNCPTPLG